MNKALQTQLIMTKAISILGLMIGLWCYSGITGAALQAYYPIDEAIGSGPTVFDQSNNSNNATLQGNASRMSRSDDTDYVNAINYTGVREDRVMANDHASLRINGDMTLMAWVRIESGSGSLTWPIIRKGGFGNDLNYRLEIWGSRLLAFNFINTSGSFQQAYCNSCVIPLGSWHHVAIVYRKNAGTTRFFYDGVFMEEKTSASGTPATTVGNSGRELYIGYDVADRWFKGDIDEVKIFNHALADSDIPTEQQPPPPDGNNPPTANAGPDQTVSENTTVNLNGTGSSDSDGSITSYSWTQTAGPSVSLSGANTQTPSFTAPGVSTNTILTFQLTVTDNNSATDSDSVNITVNNVIVPPTANAGSDQTVQEGTTVNLDGSASNDSDGSITTYSWSQTAGPAVSLSNANTATPSFTAPNVSGNTILTFQLTVTDTDNATGTDSVNITVTDIPIIPPTANAGVDQPVQEGANVGLDGSGSTDSDGTIVGYSWIQTAGPSVTLSGANTATPGFTAPNVTATTNLTFQLTVTDNDSATDTDTVTITVTDSGGGGGNWDSVDSDIFNTNSGNVGVGTSNPNAKLQIGSGDNDTPVANSLSIQANGEGSSGNPYKIFDIYNPATNPNSEQFAIEFELGKTHLLNRRGSLALQRTGGTVDIGSSSSSVQLNTFGDANFTGTVTGGNIVAKYQDIAEWVPANKPLDAGTVVILDPDKINSVIPSINAYDTSVAGVISAQPGLLLGEESEGMVKVATTGRVRVRVNADKGAINIGDLLVTSDEKGVAMKSVPIEIQGRKMHAPGTLIGKALEPLAKGRGEILILLSLQ